MIRFLRSFYQRHAAKSMFGHWSPTYEEDVAHNHYSAADRVAEATIKYLAPIAANNPMIIDAGVGTGLLSQQIFDAMPCRVAGLDFCEDMLSVCLQKDITELLIKCDVGKDHWPLENGAYDAVISAGLAEYLTREMLQHFLHETHRCLQQSGFFIFTYVPIGENGKETEFWRGKSGNFLSCRYDPLLMEDMLKTQHFEIIEHSTEFTGSVFRDGSTYPYRLIAARKI